MVCYFAHFEQSLKGLRSLITSSGRVRLTEVNLEAGSLNPHHGVQSGHFYLGVPVDFGLVWSYLTCQCSWGRIRA